MPTCDSINCSTVSKAAVFVWQSYLPNLMYNEIIPKIRFRIKPRKLSAENLETSTTYQILDFQTNETQPVTSTFPTRAAMRWRSPSPETPTAGLAATGWAARSATVSPSGSTRPPASTPTTTAPRTRSQGSLGRQPVSCSSWAIFWPLIGDPISKDLLKSSHSCHRGESFFNG